MDTKEVNEYDKEYDVTFEVSFDGSDDQEDATRISHLRKWFIVIVISFGSLCVTCLSSTWSLAAEHIMLEFKVSHEVATLGISLYIWALGTGGMILAPFSEYYGRKITYVLGLSLTAAFNLLPEFSHNYGSVLFGRFMSGFFASSFMAVAGGTFSDIFSKEELAYPVALYTMSPFAGPGFGPLLSGFTSTYLTYRWAFHILSIAAVAITLLVLFFVPETYQPVLLKRKAQRLRKEHNDDRYYAPIEKDKMPILQAIKISCKRPIDLLFFDKMTIILCFYTGFTLAIVYMFFVAIPYTFQKVYGFTLLQTGMSFLGLVVGMVFSSAIGPYFVDKRIVYLTETNGEYLPEYRFYSIKIGVFIVPVGLLIMGWTAYSHVHWIVPIIGSGIYGFGTIFVFNGIFGYTVDAYRLYSASAMAINSFVRSIMAGVFPLFGLQMYSKITVHWANTLLAGLGILLIPVAFWFAKHGKTLRSQSPYAWA